MDIKVEICSPPDRENLVIAVMIEKRQFCEISQEDGKLEWEFYPNKDNLPWVIEHGEFISTLRKSLERLDSINQTTVKVTNFKEE
ncbi:MAG: hypothetical protein QM758_04405 [Armatimonas sp.]